MTPIRKATKTELFSGCLLGFLVSFLSAAYYLDWWVRLTK